MASTEHTLTPAAVALHTRDRNEDYRWYPEVGPAHLVGLLKGLHRELIADQDAKPATTFILFDQKGRLGLLIANIKTERMDHSRTRIDDTIVLEFENKDRETVYRLAAGLLSTDAQALLRLVHDYAESQFQRLGQAASIEPLTLPVPNQDNKDADSPQELLIGLRSNEKNQRRVVALLHRAASNPLVVKMPFVLVSTGFVGKDKLQQQATVGHQFIALSRSSSIPENEDVSLEKKKARSRLPIWIMAAVGVGLVIMSLVAWALLQIG